MTPPVASLADGRTGAIAFEALTPRNSCDLVSGRANQKSTIAGVLTLPETAGAPDAPKASFPAMVVVHGSSGVLQNDWTWEKRLNEMGVATFVIDNFTGRGVRETATDQSRLFAGGRCGWGPCGAAPALHPSSDQLQADRRHGLLARRSPQSIRRSSRSAARSSTMICVSRLMWRLSWMRRPARLGASRRLPNPDAARRQG